MEEKKYNSNKLFSIGILILLFVLFILIIVGEGVYKILGTDLGKTKSTSFTIDVDWGELYPFGGDLSQDADKTTGNSNKLNSVIIKYSEIMNSFETIGDIWVVHILKYSEIAKYGDILNVCISGPGIGGEYIRLSNGYWTTVKSLESDEAVEEKVNAVIDFFNYVDYKNIPFLYVQPAVKNCQYGSELPVGVEDYTNVNIDKVLAGLEDLGVECLDMRKKLHEEYDDHYELFYKTDHHWTLEAGFWACGIIENEIESRFKIDFKADYNDLTEYRKQIYENAMFGSAGHAVTHFVEDSEDFSIYFPLFETDFKLAIPDKGIDGEGTFEELFVDDDTLKNIIDEGGGYAYETVLYGNRPLVQIKNLNNESGLKVLMIRDSFSIAVAPYLALGCSELDLIDIRQLYGNFTGSIRTYIDQVNPDIVIMLAGQPETSYK